jgi:hypothetical protein
MVEVEYDMKTGLQNAIHLVMNHNMHIELFDFLVDELNVAIDQTDY